MRAAESPNRRGLGEFKSSDTSILKYKIDESSDAMTKAKKGLHFSSTLLDESFAQKTPRKTNGNPFEARPLSVSPISTNSFRQGHNRSAPPIARIKAWYENPAPKANGRMTGFLPKNVDIGIRLDKVESDSTAFRERMVGEVEGAFKNAVMRIEALREDMLSTIRSNSNNLEAQIKASLASTIDESNKRELEFRQRVSAQITKGKREVNERSHDQAMAIDRLAQRLGAMEAEMKQNERSVSSVSAHRFSDLEGKVDQIRLKLDRVNREEKSHSANTEEAIERLQGTVDRLSAEQIALQSTSRSRHEQQLLALDEKVRQAVDTRRWRQESVEEQIQSQLKKLRQNTERNLLDSMKELSEENVRLNAKLVELHDIVKGSLEAQRAGKREREELKDEVSQLRLSVKALSKDQPQAREALALARRVEKGREVDQKKLESVLIQASKRGETLADCKFKIKELGHKLETDISARQRQLSSLEHSMKAFTTMTERGNSQIANEWTGFEDRVRNKLKAFAEAQKAQEDRVKVSQQLTTDSNAGFEAKLKVLDSVIKARFKGKSTEFDLLRSLRSEHEQSVEMMEKRLDSLRSSLSSTIDAKVSVAMQTQVSQAAASVDQVSTAMADSFSVLYKRMDTLHKSMREIDSRVTDVVNINATGKNSMDLKSCSSDLEYKLKAMEKEILANKEEIKATVRISAMKETSLSNAETEMKRILGKKMTEFDQSSSEIRRRIMRIEQKLSRKISRLDPDKDRQE
eukprot:jgi/Bigna1/143538/aug1.79_g18246